MRTYTPSAAMTAPEIPLHLMGWDGWDGRAQLKPRHMAGVFAPREPLHNLGALASGAQIVGSAAPIAAIATTASLTTFTSVGAAAGPIGAAVGAVIGIIAGLWAAHDARAKGAKTENAVLNSALQAFDGSLKAVFSAANAGQIGASDAANICSQIMQSYWAAMKPYQSGAGRSDASNSGTSCPPKVDWSSKTCTAGCSYGCWYLEPIIQQAVAIFQAGGGTLKVNGSPSNKYGFSGHSGYTLTFTAPAGVTGALSSIESSLGGGSMLPLLLLGVGAWLVLK